MPERKARRTRSDEAPSPKRAATPAAAAPRPGLSPGRLTAGQLEQILSGAPALLGVVWEAWLLADGNMQRVDFANEQVEAMLGYTAAEWRSTPNFWESIVHPEDHARATRELREILARGKGGTSRFRWVGRSGRVVWVETQAVVALDESGRPAGMRGVTMDITERLAGEEQLRYQLSFNAAITNSLAEGVCTLDTDGRLTFLNPAAEKLLGHPRSELLGRQLHDLMHVPGPAPGDHDAAVCPLLEPVRTGKTHTSIEDAFLRGNGTWFPVVCSVAPIHSGGEVTGVAVAFHDVSDRKHADQLRSIRLGVTQILMESLTLDGTAERVLHTLCRGLGWDLGALWLHDRKSGSLRCHATWSEPALASDAFDGLAPDNQFDSGWGLPSEVVQSRRAIWVRDFYRSPYARAAAGTRRQLRGAVASPIHLADEVIGAIELFSREVREPDEEMTEVIANVGVQLGLFIERTRAEHQIVSWNQELQTMLHVVSHDLREPLRGIESFTGLLAERCQGQLDHNGQDYLRRILGSAGRLRRLLDDIMELARARRIEPASEEVESGAMVGEALGRLEHAIASSGAKVKVSPVLPAFRVDRTWATQAIYNLIANALKFTAPGQPPQIEIAPYPDGASEPSGLVVKDRGPGVAPEHAERIFQLFQRAVGRDVDGTGAGLAIVKEVANRHGGKAWVIPRPGGGSEFVITFSPRE